MSSTAWGCCNAAQVGPALELEDDADFKAVKAAYRRLAKEHHPDRHKGDKEAAKRFHAIQAAYDVLKKAEERRTGAKL